MQWATHNANDDTHKHKRCITQVSGAAFVRGKLGLKLAELNLVEANWSANGFRVSENANPLNEKLDTFSDVSVLVELYPLLYCMTV